MRYGLPRGSTEFDAIRISHQGAPVGGQPLHRRFEFHAGMHLVGRPGAQDQPATVRAERVGGATGAAGEPAQIGDLGPDQVGKVVSPDSFPAELQHSLGHRRIWISSAPSVIR